MKDLHVHTTYSDGKNTPREMVEAALEKGLTTLGFSDHSYTAFDESYCIKREAFKDYVSEILSLKKEYAGRIEIKLGLEQDYFSDDPEIDVDYKIGSVHYVKVKDEFLPIDESAETFVKVVNEYFGGDYYALAESYFSLVGNVVEKTGADIVGHFDLITKYNENDALFSTKNACYVSAWKKAADKLLAFNVPFEINTGAIARGYRVTPYPSFEIISYLKERGGKFILSSDSHSANTLCFAFDEYESLL